MSVWLTAGRENLKFKNPNNKKSAIFNRRESGKGGGAREIHMRDFSQKSTKKAILAGNLKEKEY